MTVPVRAAETPKGRLAQVLAHLRHHLPAQGPIGVFIHHNTLHSFEDRPFEQAVLDAAQLFGTEPYMTEAAYREAFDRDRITEADVDQVLAGEPDMPVVGTVTQRQLRRALLVTAFVPPDPRSVRWLMEEGAIAQRVAADPGFAALLRVCEARLPAARVADAPAGAGVPPSWWATMHPWIIRLCSVFTDQGMAYWPMAHRDEGFYRAVQALMVTPAVVVPSDLRGIREAFARQRADGNDAESVVIAWLQARGTDDWEAALHREALALPGWAGIFATLEDAPGLAPHHRLPCRLVDYLAVRCTFDDVARRHARHDGQASPVTVDAAALRQAQVAALADAASRVAISADLLDRASGPAFERFAAAVYAFSANERRRVWHAAYERQHEREVLDGIAVHRREAPPQPRTETTAHVFCCIDEREESFRRALEETDSSVETLGAAGFFGVAVNYQGLDDAHGVPLCPVVVTPAHAVRERARETDGALHVARQRRRRLIGQTSHALTVSSRSLLRGFVSTAALGLLSAVPLIGRVLAPRTFGRWRAALNDLFLPLPRTELTLMRDDAEGDATVEGLLQGFSIEEKAHRVASVLAPAGLTAPTAPLLVILGHGSTSLNNPHESAHDCGACGGRRGGPNARLFAAMANHPLVRERLRTLGVDLPASTHCVGGYHDTCSDDVVLFDLDAVPDSHAEAVSRLQATFDEARARNAHERSRRFEHFSPRRSARAALVHVEERAEHLAQPRPEYGHGTNAVCIVGRRATTQGLFLDRRAFLVSYDAAPDADNRRLAALLGAAMPVCAGISLEYYFSFVDNERYGCGTKLPHNVTGLLGVMNGQGSDLRTGLPWQMVEIHEPVRILFVIETTPERLTAVLAANPALERLVRHRWIRVSTLDPDSGKISVYRSGVWDAYVPGRTSLPVAVSSPAYYTGRIEHLPPARITGRPVSTEARAS